MKHLTAGLLLTLAFCLQGKAQSIPSPLLDIEFNKEGIVLGGTDAANHTATPYNTYNTHTLYDPIKDKYYGCTNYTTDGYYYINYDADDNLGKAFQSEATWELLYRMDNMKANATTTITQKIFSSQEGGGWSIMYTAGTGFRMEYVTTGNTIHYIKASKDNGATGKFFHIIVTVNKTTNKGNLYVNGEQLVKDADLGTDPFLFGNFGNPAREKNMWFCIGGDCAATSAPGTCQNSTRGTFVYAKIYDKALTATNVSELYNTPEVKYYTEPTKPTVYNDMILDVVFGKNGTATDKSPYKAAIGVNRTPETQYNAEQKRYEGTRTTNTAFNFFYRDYFYDPSITTQMGDAFSYEIYCKSAGDYTTHTCPFSNQQDGGTGFEFYTSTGKPYFICNTVYAASSKLATGKGSNMGSTAPDAEYNHYVCVFDRLNHQTKMYINGVLEKTVTMNTGDFICFPYQAYGWWGIMADTRANFTHDNNDYPFAGQMSIARVWGKALSANEVSELYEQASSINTEIQIDETGYAPLYLPYTTIVPQGMTAYVPTKQEGSNVTFDILAKAGEAVDYGTPFLLKGEPGSYNLEIANTSTQVKVASTNLMEGSFLSKDINAYTLATNGTDIVLSHDVNASFAEKAAFIPYTTGGAETLNMVFTDHQVDQPVVVVPDSVTGDNVYGRITCNGAGVAGVKVSDGFEMVKTDKNGYYSFRSEKKNGYVFYSLPSGYMPFQDATASREEKIFIPFWQTFKNTSPAIAEEHNFQLQVQNNDEFYYMAGADSHLANRYNDLDQFHKGYIESVRKEKENAGNVPIYSTILGDNAWDSYWYGNNFNLKNFRSTLAEYDYALPLFPCMGNHDNDGSTPYDANTDFNASAPFRAIMAPNYYSYNLGQIHFITLDDIFYINSGNPSGTACVGSRNYAGYIPQYQLDWVKKDLEDVDVNTPIIIQTHIPVWMRNSTVLDSCQAYLVYNNISSSDSLCALVKDYKTVHIITGHTHYNYHVHPVNFPNVHENNIAAICAIWWYSGYISGWHNCRDGVPGGYEMFHINGKNIEYQYRSIEDNGNAQFHVLDMNSVKEYYSGTDMQALIAKYPSYYYTDFSKWNDNMLLMNVFNYDEDWKVEVFENGTPLQAQRIFAEDPYHVLTYDMLYYKKGSSIGSDSRATKNSHMLKVQCATATEPIKVRVTDSFGNIYEQEINRPMAFDLNAIPVETQQIVTAIDEKTYQATHNAAVYTVNNKIIVKADQSGTCQIITIDGKAQTHNIAAGTNEISVSNRGIYLVKYNGVVKKLFVK